MEQLSKGLLVAPNWRDQRQSHFPLAAPKGRRSGIVMIVPRPRHLANSSDLQKCGRMKDSVARGTSTTP